jgi:hypothetical protein
MCEAAQDRTALAQTSSFRRWIVCPGVIGPVCDTDPRREPKPTDRSAPVEWVERRSQ